MNALILHDCTPPRACTMRGMQKASTSQQKLKHKVVLSGCYLASMLKQAPVQSQIPKRESWYSAMSPADGIDALQLSHDLQVSIRRLVPADVAAWYAAVTASLPGLSQWEQWPSQIKSPSDALDVLYSHEDEWRKGRECHFALWMGDEIVGAVAITSCQFEHRCATLGYWVACRHWGRGIASWAASAIVGWAFEHLHLHRMELLIRADNSQSLRIAHKLGAVHEGTVRQRIHDGEKALDAFQFSILAPEWRPVWRAA